MMQLNRIPNWSDSVRKHGVRLLRNLRPFSRKEPLSIANRYLNAT
jgi:hypothetical protein